MVTDEQIQRLRGLLGLYDEGSDDVLAIVDAVSILMNALPDLLDEIEGRRKGDRKRLGIQPKEEQT